jgi:Asp-tRNA(Asn)/Glu-tRNA(Gln) amidotransferase C subunit
MRTEQLLLSGLDITEDGYIFKGQFILSNKNKSKHVDMEELEQRSFLEDLKNFFELEEPIREIRNKIIDMVVEKAQISSKIRDGRNYEELFAK